MRTTLDLNDALLIRAKAEAARQRTTLTRLIERGLEHVLDHPVEPAERRPPFRWKVFGGDGPPMDMAAYQQRVAAAEEEYDRRQAGLLPLSDADEPA